MPNYEFTPERGFRLDEDRVSVKPQPSLLRALYNNSVALFDAGVVAGTHDAQTNPTDRRALRTHRTLFEAISIYNNPQSKAYSHGYCIGFASIRGDVHDVV